MNLYTLHRDGMIDANVKKFPNDGNNVGGNNVGHDRHHHQKQQQQQHNSGDGYYHSPHEPDGEKKQTMMTTSPTKRKPPLLESPFEELVVPLDTNFDDHISFITMPKSIRDRMDVTGKRRKKRKDKKVDGSRHSNNNNVNDNNQDATDRASAAAVSAVVVTPSSAGPHDSASLSQEGSRLIDSQGVSTEVSPALPPMIPLHDIPQRKASFEVLEKQITESAAAAVVVEDDQKMAMVMTKTHDVMPVVDRTVHPGPGNDGEQQQQEDDPNDVQWNPPDVVGNVVERDGVDEDCTGGGGGSGVVASSKRSSLTSNKGSSSSKRSTSCKRSTSSQRRSSSEKKRTGGRSSPTDKKEKGKKSRKGDKKNKKRTSSKKDKKRSGDDDSGSGEILETNGRDLTAARPITDDGRNDTLLPKNHKGVEKHSQQVEEPVSKTEVMEDEDGDNDQAFEDAWRTVLPVHQATGHSPRVESYLWSRSNENGIKKAKSSSKSKSSNKNKQRKSWFSFLLKPFGRNGRRRVSV